MIDNNKVSEHFEAGPPFELTPGSWIAEIRWLSVYNQKVRDELSPLARGRGLKPLGTA